MPFILAAAVGVRDAILAKSLIKQMDIKGRKETASKALFHIINTEITELVSNKFDGAIFKIERLLKSGADINSFDKNGETPLAILIRKTAGCTKEVLAILLLRAKNPDWKLPKEPKGLKEVYNERFRDAIYWWMDRGARLDLKQDGIGTNSPCEYLVLEKDCELVRKVLQYPKIINIRNVIDMIHIKLGQNDL